jgi:hypothetical protein
MSEEKKQDRNCCEGFCVVIKPQDKGFSVCIQAEDKEKAEALKAMMAKCCGETKSEDCC